MPLLRNTSATTVLCAGIKWLPGQDLAITEKQFAAVSKRPSFVALKIVANVEEFTASVTPLPPPPVVAEVPPVEVARPAEPPPVQIFPQSTDQPATTPRPRGRPRKV